LLKELYCTSNSLLSLNISKNTALKELHCSFNCISYLDVSKNTALKELYCSGNILTSLDVSKNTALEYMDCSINALTSLDVSKNTALKELKCNNNILASLDVSKNTALEKLVCFNNILTSLDVSKNTALWYLDCGDNLITSMNVTGCPLGYLYCWSNFMSDKSDVIGLDESDLYLEFNDQYTGAPLIFMFDKEFVIPPTDGEIKDVDVSTGVTGGTGPYSFYLDGNPAGLDIDKDTGIISGTLEEGEYGIMTVTVISTDAGGNDLIKYLSIAYGMILQEGEDDDEDDGNNGSGILLYVAVIAIAAVAIAAVAYIFFIRPKA
jgi:hypothetical protein